MWGPWPISIYIDVHICTTKWALPALAPCSHQLMALAGANQGATGGTIRRQQEAEHWREWETTFVARTSCSHSRIFVVTSIPSC